MTAEKKRVTHKKSEKQALISGQKSLNLAVKAFCEKEGLHDNQFYIWKRQLHNWAPTPSRNNFIELSSPQHSFALEILLPNGILVRSHQPEVVLNAVPALLTK